MTFEVKRSEWLRGNVRHSGLFVRLDKRDPGFPERKRCCLGFFANACGIADREIAGCKEPSCHRHEFGKSKSPEWMSLTVRGKDFVRISGSTSLCRDLMGCNDDHHISEKDREKELTKLFLLLGHSVVFVD